MRYVRARIGEFRRDLTYRVYISDALRIISESAAKIGGGGYITARYADMVFPKPEDNRTAEEVIEHIRGKLRGLGEHEN